MLCNLFGFYVESAGFAYAEKEVNFWLHWQPEDFLMSVTISN